MVCSSSQQLLAFRLWQVQGHDSEQGSCYSRGKGGAGTGILVGKTGGNQVNKQKR